MKATLWAALARLLVLALSALGALSAHAVPSFARQTGEPCVSCHIGGFGPQLTPFGMRFKLGGYTQSDGKAGKVPLAAMLVGSWTRTAQDQEPPPQHFDSNNNSAWQEASVFLAGRMTDNIGTFVQATYSGIDLKSALDNADVRYARPMQWGGRDVVVGVSVNNNPTVQDPLNTLPAWRFPFMASELVPEFMTPMIENLAQSTLGVTGYAFVDDSIYGEIGVYNSLSKTALNMVNAEDPGKFKNPAAYWRLAYLKTREQDAYSAGVVGFSVDNQPDRSILGTADKFRDLGVDASYQFLGSGQHVFTVNASYMREWQKLDFSFGNAGASNRKNFLDQFRIAGSYYYNQTWGMTAGWFDTHGSADDLLNASSLNGRPDTSGYTLQADWTPFGKDSSWEAPFANVRLGVQYTGYRHFNGDRHYLDDSGNDRKASDNNTLFLFFWTAI